MGIVNCFPAANGGSAADEGALCGVIEIKGSNKVYISEISSNNILVYASDSDASGSATITYVALADFTGEIPDNPVSSRNTYHAYTFKKGKKYQHYIRKNGSTHEYKFTEDDVIIYNVSQSQMYTSSLSNLIRNITTQ